MAGYVYCFSTQAYPDLLFVSAGTKKPNEKADELFSEGVLYPFKVELAKQVGVLEGKVVSLHRLLAKLGERISPNRDFFKVSLETVQTLFDLVDGEVWAPTAPISENAWMNLMEKVGTIMKQENPKANEFQLNKLKMKVASSLKSRYGENFEPTVEMVREALTTVQ
jgi:hypothetical protein